jgi:hypothetical protein
MPLMTTQVKPCVYTMTMPLTQSAPAHGCTVPFASMAAFLRPSGFSAGKPLSKWLVNHRLGKNEDAYERRAVFVVSQRFLLLTFGACCSLCPEPDALHAVTLGMPPMCMCILRRTSQPALAASSACGAPLVYSGWSPNMGAAGCLRSGVTLRTTSR